MKSGPRELKAYHELVLRAERNNVTTEEQEALERGQARLAQMTNGAEKPQRKIRSDKGTTKAKKEPEIGSGNEIVLRVSVNKARILANGAAGFGHDDLAAEIQDQVIAQLQKRIDALSKQ